MTASVPVRQDILTSWQRSVVAGLDGARVGLLLTDGAGEKIGVIDLTCAAEDFNPLLLPFAKRAARQIGHRFRESADPGRLPVRGWLSLTDTERAVAHLAAQGLSSRGVADRLGLPRPAVRSHLRRALRKMGVRSREALANVADQPAAAR
jgi:DNA-binding CsgD family transcriptional regulator